MLKRLIELAEIPTFSKSFSLLIIKLSFLKTFNKEEDKPCKKELEIFHSEIEKIVLAYYEGLKGHIPYLNEIFFLLYLP